MHYYYHLAFPFCDMVQPTQSCPNHRKWAFMQLHQDFARRLDAVVSVKGKIVAWKCTACKWSKLAEDPYGGATDNTKLLFDKHDCTDHPDGKTARQN